MGKLDETLGAELNGLREKNLIWKIHVLGGASAPRTSIDGKDVLVMCSNNYLGLSNHPKLKRAAIQATRKYGAGSGSVRVIAGTMDLHVKLEETIARFKRTEDAIAFQTGFMANQGSIPQLIGEGDLVISDELNHGSIIDGVRLTKAERKIYPHKNMEELEKILQEAGAKNYRRKVIITDGVFSMDGDIAPLPRIVELAEKYGAISYVDDAHGDGVLGENGRGIVNHFKLEGRVDVEMGTFSKAFGVVGGYVAGSKILCEFLRNKARSFLLTGSHPPATAAACIASLELLEQRPQIVKKLWRNTKFFKKRMRRLGFDICESETPITPVMTGDSALANKLSEELFAEGVFALPIVYPMVAMGKARIRTQVSAAHTRDDLEFALATFEKCGKKLGVIQ